MITDYRASWESLCFAKSYPAGPPRSSPSVTNSPSRNGPVLLGDTAPRFLIRDRDRAYGLVFSARLRGLGIREIRTAVRAPRMNAFAKRVIGTLRRECFDHLIVLNQPA